MVYDILILVCSNQRNSADKLSCDEKHGLELVGDFKKQIKELNINFKTRANKSGCLGVCDLDPIIVIYPEGTFYIGVKKEDVKEIVQSHIIIKIPVERLILESWKN